MFNRKYKKGLADAAKAYEAFGKKQEEALKHILEEVRQGKRDMQSALKEIDGHIDNIYDYLQSKEKATLYTVYTPFDLKELGEKERLFLVGALFRLTMDKVPNEDQQNYLRAIQKYLEIKEPPFGTDPLAIENIEDLPTQKAILQAVLEFLRLQDGDSYDETELQQEFLDAFSVNNKGRQEIMEHIELLYTATGAKGLAEKYGYVPEDESDVEEDEVSQNSSDHAETTYAVSPEQEKTIDILVSLVGPINNQIIETKNYILGKATFDWFRLDKVSGEKTRYKSENLGVSPADWSKSAILNDTIYFECDNALSALDVSTMQKTAVAPSPSYIKSISACDDKVAFVAGNDRAYIYDVITKKCCEVIGISNCESVFSVSTGIYLLSLEDSYYCTIHFYEYETKKNTLVATKVYRTGFTSLLYCKQPNIFYILDSETYGTINIRKVGTMSCTLVSKCNNVAEDGKKYPVMTHIHAYRDCLIFVGPGGKLEKVDYETGETTMLADDAIEHNHLDGGLFRRSSSWDTPADFSRVGNFLYYFARGDYEHVCKLSIINPNEKEILSRDYNNWNWEEWSIKT